MHQYWFSFENFFRVFVWGETKF